VPIPRPLFQGKPPDNPARRQAAESTYKFLDRVDDPVFAGVRATLNAWFKRFEAHQDHAAVADLRGRLRAKQSLQFDAAFWELYLHELDLLAEELGPRPAEVNVERAQMPSRQRSAECPLQGQLDRAW